MRNLTLTEPADFGAVYDAARRSYDDAGWQRATQGYLTRENFIATCLALKLPSLGFTCNGVPIGGIVFDGTAVHIEVLPEYHGRWGFLWEEARNWVFAQKDPMVVRIDADNAKCRRFMHRNGWRCIEEDATYATYEMSSRDTPRYRRRARGETSVSAESSAR